MKRMESIQIGDEVLLLTELMDKLKFNVYVVESVAGDGMYYLKDVYPLVYDHEIVKYRRMFFKYNITDGEYPYVKQFIEERSNWLQGSEVGYYNDHPAIHMNLKNLNLESIFSLGISLGKQLQAKESEIELAENASSESRRLNENEAARSNNSWNESQSKVDMSNGDDYSEDRMRNDDPYNPNNWLGHE
jgi:hypothetical protein